MSTSSFGRKRYARWRADITEACKRPDTNKPLMAIRKTKNSINLLSFQTQSNKTLFSKEASALHPTSKILGRKLLERPCLLEKEALDLIRRLNLEFSGVFGMSFRLGCVAPIDHVLCCRVRGCLTVKMYSPSSIWFPTMVYQPKQRPGWCAFTWHVR